ncbi:MAG TPA: glycosyltransferase [Candidatus Limnocylindrales bacterium]
MDFVFFADPTSVHTERWASGLRSRGHSVRIIPDNEGSRRGVSKVIAWLRLMWQARRATGRSRAILVAHWIPAGLRATLLMGTHPRIGVAWGSDIYLTAGGSARLVLRMRQQAAFLRGCDAVVAPSEDLARATRVIADRPVDVIPLGVDAASFAGPTRGSGRGHDPHEIVIGFAKSLQRIYGPDLIVEAAALLAKDPTLPRTRFRLAGSGTLGPELAARAAELGIADRIELVGRIEPSAMPEFLAGLDIYVMPSRSESLGVGALEAAAAGLPVVATRVGGIPEAVADGETGLLVPSEDAPALASALGQLAQDKDLRARLGEAGRRRVVAEFDWQMTLTRFEAVAQRVAERC